MREVLLAGLEVLTEVVETAECEAAEPELIHGEDAIFGRSDQELPAFADLSHGNPPAVRLHGQDFFGEVEGLMDIGHVGQ